VCYELKIKTARGKGKYRKSSKETRPRKRPAF
jgi:hypothetical protein